jgi:hypothetical protein
MEEDSFEDLEEWIGNVKPKILAESFEEVEQTRRVETPSKSNKSFGEEFEDLKVWAMERGQKTLNICRSQSEKENMSRPIFFRYILTIWSTIVTNGGLPQKACCSPLKTAITALFLVSFVVLTHHIFDVQTLSQSYSNNI